MKTQNDKGLFKRRGSPNWWIRYADRTGRIRRESTGTTVKKLAREILAKRKVEVAENRNLDIRKVPKTTFFQLCDYYWETEGYLKRMNGLEGMIKTWKRHLKNIPVKDITPRRIQIFLNTYVEENQLSPATRNRHLTMMKAMFNRGLHWNLIAENPTHSLAFRPACSPSHLRDPLHRRLRRIRYLLRRSDCYRVERLVPGWESHPLRIAGFTRRTTITDTVETQAARESG